MKSIFKKIVVSIITLEAKLVLKRHRPKIVAITGSVGKTSTKDTIYSVFPSSVYVRKSAKSFNSEIGVPLTILGCPNGWSSPVIWTKNIFKGLFVLFFKRKYPEWLVLEVGVDRPGDIKHLGSYLKPDVVIVTRLSKVPVHVEFFPSAEELYKEKGYLVRALKREGTLILNVDDPDVERYKNIFSGETIFYGVGPGARVVASNYNIFYEESSGDKKPIGITFKVDYAGSSVPVKILGTLGRQSVYSALAAVSFGVSQGFNLVGMTEQLYSLNTPPGRMRLLDGVKESLIIDDSYNSSPTALSSALNTLKEIETSGRKIAVLGDMMEIGEFSAEEHKKAGLLAATFCDILITVGIRSRQIAEGALQGEMSEKNIFQFEDSRKAGKHLELLIQKGDRALIKGSQAVRMERAVEEVMAEPKKKKELLVRQEKHWTE